MDIQFAQFVTDSRGKEIETPDKTKLTLGRAVEMALDSAFESDRDEGLQKKLNRGKLLDKIVAAEKDMTPIKLEAEEVSIIKDRVSKFWAAASVVRNICRAVDEATE